MRTHLQWRYFVKKDSLSQYDSKCVTHACTRVNRYVMCSVSFDETLDIAHEYVSLSFRSDQYLVSLRQLYKSSTLEFKIVFQSHLEVKILSMLGAAGAARTLI